VGHGASKLKRKTILALVHHITESLPGPDEDLVQPLVQDYIKSLVSLLAHHANAEQLATRDGGGWLDCVDFCVQSISRYLESGERDSGPNSRSSPAPGTVSTVSLTYSGARSGSGSHQKLAGQISSTTVRDLLHCLQYLVTTANAPVSKRTKEISSSVTQILQVRHASPSQIQQYAFAIFNCVLAATQVDDLAASSSLARDLVPLISHWWQGRTASQDEMLKSLRDEMLKTIFTVHLHLENLVVTADDDSSRKDVEELLEVLWLEYSRRGERAQLHLDDLTFASSGLPRDYFTINIFGLRPHNLEGERQWALVQCLALLEATLLRRKPRERPGSAGDEAQPRKKRRTAAEASRLRQKLRSPIAGTQRTALHVIPFLFHGGALHPSEASDIFADLANLLSDKHGGTASWAMLGCARQVPYRPLLSSM
jgi:serine-protein kinase ATM